MKIPNLRPNDKVAITAPAKRIARAEIDAAVKILISWGLQVVVGETIDSEYFQFSGTKEQRLDEVQNLLDDPDIKAIFFARGGYGSIQIIDDIGFRTFKKNRSSSMSSTFKEGAIGVIIFTVAFVIGII